MKAIKISVITAVALAGLVSMGQTSAIANEGHGYEKKFSPAERVEKLKEKLSLTDEQATKLQTIFESHKPSDAEIAAMKAKKEAFKAEINAVLTPEQAAKLKELREERKDKKHDGHKRDHKKK